MDLRESPPEAVNRHPWERARARFFSRVVRDHVPSARPLRVLDVGAGDGFVSDALIDVLHPGSTITCFDPGYDAGQLARFAAAAKPGVSFTQQRPQAPHDLCLLLDVLEHVVDDRALLRELLATSLKPDACVLVSVPARAGLFSQHDVALGHHRRYDAASLRATLQDVGLRPLVSGGLFHSLIVPRAAKKLGERIRGLSSEPPPPMAPLPEHISTDITSWRLGGAVTSVVDAALALDNSCSRLFATLGVDVPGMSEWALARRAPGS